MLSIIICSRNPDISSTLKENIKNTTGVDYEIIVVDNSKNNYSIFSAYNKGIQQSKFPYLCFVHEDVSFISENWGEKVVQHLSNEKTGIIGIAGGGLMTRIPSSWSIGNSGMNIIQYDKNKTKILKVPADYMYNSYPAILLDGVFLSMRRNLYSSIKFDETFSGFHGYDFDISTQSIVAGYNNYIVYDVLLEHYSAGKKNFQYFYNLIQVYKKWENCLPLLSRNSYEKYYQNLSSIENKRLKKLIKNMIVTGFKTQDIISNIKHFANLLDTPEAYKQLKYLKFKIIVLKLIKSPHYLFR